jgi:hypothetical protein
MNKKLLSIIIFSLLWCNISFGQIPEDQINYGIKQCQIDKQQFKASKMTLKNYNLFCECYIRSMMGLLNAEEMAYQKKYQKPSPKYINEAQKIKSKCT